jgi:hypothetical protein
MSLLAIPRIKRIQRADSSYMQLTLGNAYALGQSITTYMQVDFARQTRGLTVKGLQSLVTT